jgi:hypothetical protein
MKLRITQALLLNTLAFAAQAGTITPPALPASLTLPAAYQLASGAHATGYQIYQCGPAKEDASRVVWNFKAPEANLTDADGKPIGHHYAGPTWESTDGSKVVGQLKVSDPGPDMESIAWLLLDAKSNAGSGVFANVTAILRVATHGGKAPAGGCDAARLGSELRVPYTADYLFYTGKP